MPGAPHPDYVAARCALLDAVTAVGGHLDSIVLVGAQAVYLHAGEGDLSVAPFTTDGDLAIDPSQLGPEPLIEEAMEGAGFVPKPGQIGIWVKSVGRGGDARTVPVDFLVPASVGGGGRRAARIPPHGQVARKVEGLEAALVDKDRREIAALDPADERRATMWVAGPSGLLVAKVHKIADRSAAPSRVRDKDALDVYRLLRAIPTEELVRRMRIVRDSDLGGAATAAAIEQLPRLFGTPQASGCHMAVRAAGPLENAETLAASLVALTEDLLEAV